MSDVLTKQFADGFVAEWVASWNARDLDRILKHYARDIEFTSPFVKRMLPNNECPLRGIALLRIYFSRALNAYPDLHFSRRRVYLGAQSLVVEYDTVANLLGAEMMEFNSVGLVCRVRAHYAPAAPVSESVSIRFVR